MNAKRVIAALIGISVVALPIAAGAHGSTKPVHGGIVTMSGETVIELVRAPKGVDVYLTEEDEPLAASGFAGKLIMTAAGTKTEAALVPQARNKLTAPGLSIPAGAKVVVSLTAKGSGAKTLASFQVK